ncbi:MAG TPA: ABC transporter substrate-binding protein [Solirubrobacteraceae bacterium]|nr:ABC transporter substrate-binding protein [Solirubrobacteraceae bacterium]
MRRAGFLVALGAALALAGCGGGSGKKGSAGLSASAPKPITSGHVNITVWEGYTDSEANTMKRLAAEFNKTHPHITVTPQFYGNSDYALQKVLAAIAGGNPPDVSYLYGSNAANIASTSKLVPLTNWLNQDKAFGWDHFYPFERRVATVNGKVVGIPALVDNLALVYNKTLFKQAGLSYPTKNWTWADMKRAALKLTNPAKKQFGWAYVNDASEDTVWRFWAMLWQAGGHILTPDGKKAAFDSAAGIQALDYLQSLSKAHAIYLDNGSDNYLPLFGAGHIGMLWTGPWDLEQIRQSKVDYGVTDLPADKNHQTISGPDNWVMFNNGSKRVAAAWEFLQWFTSPKVDLQWCLGTGDLPIRDDVQSLPGFKTYLKRYPGVEEWVHNLTNSKQTRPVSVVYPKISTAVGQAVQGVLLGKYQPKQALAQAAQTTNGLLSAPQG